MVHRVEKMKGNQRFETISELKAAFRRIDGAWIRSSPIGSRSTHQL
jgi:hypothetical protein